MTVFFAMKVAASCSLFLGGTDPMFPACMVAYVREEFLDERIDIPGS
jgi:hypothetical protein